MTAALLEDLAARGLHARQGLLFVIDGSKAIAAAVAQVFGENAMVQRCQVHKRRNVVEHLPKREQGWVNLRLSTAWAQSDAIRARQDLEALAKELEVQWPGAAASLREGLDDTRPSRSLVSPRSCAGVFVPPTRSRPPTRSSEPPSAASRASPRASKRCAGWLWQLCGPSPGSIASLASATYRCWHRLSTSTPSVLTKLQPVRVRPVAQVTSMFVCALAKEFWP